MATVLLLTATYIKDYTFVDPNVDEKYLRISIEEAQKRRKARLGASSLLVWARAF